MINNFIASIGNFKLGSASHVCCVTYIAIGYT